VWPRYKEGNRVRQRYVHDGEDVTAAEADDFIDAITQLTEHVAAISAR
jgi:hypothetical protein